MLQDKIKTYFNRNPQLKILFFFDPERENEEEVKLINMEGVQVEYAQNDWFNLKVKFNTIWKNQKVFLYLRMSSPQTQEDFLNFPLLGLLKANKELRLDSIADFMEEFGLKSHQINLVKKHIKELKYSQTQQVLRAWLNAANFEENKIQQGLFCVFLDLPKMEDWNTIIVRLLSYSIESKEKELLRFFKKTKENGLLDVLNKRIRRCFGESLEEAVPAEVVELVKRMKYNSIVQEFVVNEADPYKALKIKDVDCIEPLNQLREMGLNHPYLGKNFDEVLKINGASILESRIIELYGADANYVYMTDELKWEVIRYLLNQCFEQPGNSGKILERISIQTQEDGSLKGTLSFLVYTTELFNKIDQIKSLVFDTPDEYIQKYTAQFYLIDHLYRKCVFIYRSLELNTIPVEELLEQLKLQIENKYSKFIYTLNREWLSCLSSKQFEYNSISCPKQFDFFKRLIQPLKQKVAVIISDALRYEVAQELLNELHTDDKNVSELSCQLASLPSETAFGMANLLPGKSFVYDGEIKIDGEKPFSIDQRDKILKKHSDRYKAVSFETILNGSKQDNRDLFKADVIYIYHDIIDKEGHKGTERNVFNAAQVAINELSKMVKQIQGGFGVNKVIITADHGFIYNDTEIQEADKNEMAECPIIDAGARHYVTNGDPEIAIGHKIALCKTTKYQGPYKVVIPDSVNRFKKSGSRYKFTHGGGSMQELIVPVIESSRKEDKVQRKVKPLLLSHNLSIVSNNLKIQLLQENPLSAREKECTIEVGIFNDTVLVSNKVVLTLNSIGEMPSERAYTVSLALNIKSTESILKLKIFDRDDLLNPLNEENVKNNTLIERDF
ncbi:MAG: BREX-1 system phosphatase PglZ type A [Bacteroidetes bacterium]|nr:BREX-1 system phosphatase PglZ type A [Bacteroidota bacterium]